MGLKLRRVSVLTKHNVCWNIIWKWWLWNMMMMIHSFVHSFKQNEIHGGWSALREWLHQTRQDLRVWEINQIGGNIRNRLIIISWDHFNDFEDFEDDGQLGLELVYFPLKMYIFLFDLEIFAQQRIYVYCVDIFSVTRRSRSDSRQLLTESLTKR